MTMTFKLAPEMERELRRRSAALGRPASALIREALAQYLESSAPANASAFALGAEFFGRHKGPANLAEHRKSNVADAWAEKHTARRG